jgi:hypothetical protein
MLADLNVLLTAVFVSADDLLPDRAGNVRRRVTGAEVVTCAVARAIMDILSDREVVAVAAQRLRGVIARLAAATGLVEAPAGGLSETIEWLTASEHGSRPSCSPWPPASGSTTPSPEPSPHSPPDHRALKGRGGEPAVAVPAPVGRFVYPRGASEDRCLRAASRGRKGGWRGYLSSQEGFPRHPPDAPARTATKPITHRQPTPASRATPLTTPARRPHGRRRRSRAARDARRPRPLQPARRLGLPRRHARLDD